MTKMKRYKRYSPEFKREALRRANEVGVTCPIANAEELNPAILATDLVLGKDSYARRYSKFLRNR